MSFNIDIARIRELRLKVEKLQELNKKVGTTAYDLPAEATFDRSYPIEVLEGSVVPVASGSAGARIHGPNHAVDLFGTGEKLMAPAGHSLSELHLRAGFGIEAQKTLVSRPYGKLDLGASLGGEFRYHHFLPVRKGAKRLEAFRDTIRGSRLQPTERMLRRIDRGEAHQYTAWLELDLKLGAVFGKQLSFDEVVELFDDLQAPVRAHVAASLKAGMGWSVYAESEITVAGLENHWLRARMKRTRRRRFSIGATVDLRLDYDLAGPVEALLDYILELDATEDLFEGLQRIADGQWERLDERAVEAVMEWVDDSDWQAWPASSLERKGLVKLARKVVGSWEAFDAAVQDRIRSLWAGVLDVTRLRQGGVMREALERISEIDPANPDLDELFAPGADEVLELLETISGENLETLLVEKELDKKLATIRDAAAEILELADTLEQEALARFRKLKKKSRLEDVVDFLRRNASSPERLENAIERAVRPRIRRLVERLVGRVWAEIDPDDIARVQRFADKLRGFLDNREALEADLRARIARLRGTFGFSLSLELERISEKSALLDIEIDGRRDRVRDALLLGLRGGDLSAVLEELPDADADEGNAGDVDWRIREGLFTSRQVRSGTMALLTTLTGRQRNRSERVQETSIALGDGRREARYAAGYSRRLENDKLRSSEASVWWQASASGPGVQLGRKYTRVDHELRLRFARHDERTQPGEVSALDGLLNELGFAPGDASPVTTAVFKQMAAESEQQGEDLASGIPLPELDSQFVLEASLPGDATERFLNFGSSHSAWEADYLDAAHRWYAERLIVTRYQHAFPLGDVLAAFIATDAFRRHGNSQQGFLRKMRELQPIPVRLGPTTVVRTRPVEGFAGQPQMTAPFHSLHSVIGKKRRAVFRRMSEAGKDTRAAVKARDPRRLADAVGGLSRGFKSTSASFWPNPAFLPWFVLSRVSHEPELLEGVAGVATFRWRVDPLEDYRVHAWRLESGMADLRARGLFPIG